MMLKKTCVMLAALITLAACEGPKEFAADGRQIATGTNMIIVKSNVDPGVFFDQLTGNLISTGYLPKYSNKEIGAFVTEYKPLSYTDGTAPKIQLNCQIKKDGESGTIAEFTALAIYPFINNNPTPVELYGHEKSVARQAWAEMKRVASIVPGTMTYRKRS